MAWRMLLALLVVFSNDALPWIVVIPRRFRAG